MNRNDADVELFDATLRDGTQREGLSLSCDDKLRIARRLDALGVTFIEGGWPGSNPKDADFFRRAREIPWRTATIVAFGATRRAGCKVEDDLSVRALVEARTKACSVFGKSSILHVEEVLRTTRDENLRMIEETVAYVRAAGRRVIYDAEHFFDGWREDAAYALETLRAALRGGAETIVLCDTNGGSMPWQIADTVTTVRRTLDARVGKLAVTVGEVRAYGFAMLGLFTVAFTIIAVFYFARGFAHRATIAIVGKVSMKLAEKLTGMFEKFASGLAFLERGRDAGWFLVETTLYWGANALGMWLLAWGCGVTHADGTAITFGEACAMMGMLGATLLIPGPPGMVGVFQAGMYAGMAMYFSRDMYNGPGEAYVFLLFSIQVVFTFIVAGYFLATDRKNLRALKDAETLAPEAEAT